MTLKIPALPKMTKTSVFLLTQLSVIVTSTLILAHMNHSFDIGLILIGVLMLIGSFILRRMGILVVTAILLIYFLTIVNSYWHPVDWDGVPAGNRNHIVQELSGPNTGIFKHCRDNQTLFFWVGPHDSVEIDFKNEQHITKSTIPLSDIQLSDLTKQIKAKDYCSKDHDDFLAEQNEVFV